jgi:hypothetical protein
MTDPDRADGTDGTDRADGTDGTDAAADAYGADEPDVDDAFDRRVGGVLDSEAGLLRQQAELLLSAHSVSIERPGGVLTARLRRPGRLRGGTLDIATRVTDGSASGGGHLPLGRAHRGDDALLSEITLQLAVHLAWLDDPAA